MVPPLRNKNGLNLYCWKFVATKPSWKHRAKFCRRPSEYAEILQVLRKNWSGQLGSCDGITANISPVFGEHRKARKTAKATGGNQPSNTWSVSMVKGGKTLNKHQAPDKRLRKEGW